MNALRARIIDGRMQFVYDDRLVGLHDLGAASVRGVSHVEPAAAGGWLADMAPVNGPILGPFALRADALAAERVWLADRYGV